MTWVASMADEKAVHWVDLMVALSAVLKVDQTVVHSVGM